MSRVHRDAAMSELLELLERRASRADAAPALAGLDSALTAHELLLQLAELRYELRAAKPRCVALLADNGPHWALVDLACQLEGICLVPMPTFFSEAQLHHLLASAGVDLVFCEDPLARRLPQLRRLAPGFGALPAGLSAYPVQAGSRPRMPPGTTKITFTSGSTGDPRGVCLSFEQCLAVACSLRDAIGIERPRHLSILPLSTLLENIGGLYVPLLAGGTSVMIPTAELGMQGSSGLNAETFLAQLDRLQPNTLILVPQLLSVLDTALAAGWRAPASLRFVAVGGARVAPELVARVRDHGLPVYEGYGLSECASVVSLNRPGADRPGTSGRVLPHVQVRSRKGELEVSGNTFLGYLDQPDSWQRELVRTGDLGAVDEDGFLTVAGRRKHLIISSFGRNISPEWVESELLAGNEFSQAVVLGEGRPHCAALLHPWDAGLSDSQVQLAVDRANQRLPDYARIGCWLRLATPLSASDGFLTDNGRPRRGRIASAFSVALDSLYKINKERLVS